MTGSIAGKYTFAAHTYELLLLLLVNFLLFAAVLLSGVALCQRFWDFLQVKREQSTKGVNLIWPGRTRASEMLWATPRLS